MTDQVRELASLLLKPPIKEPVTLLQAVVDSFTVTHLTAYLSGGSFPVGGIRYLDSYAPRAGDVVWVAKSGPDLIAIGKLQDDDANLLKPYNMGWGILALQSLETSSSNYSATGNSDLALLNFPCRSDRNYRIGLNSNFVLSAAALWGMSFRVDGVEVGRSTVITRQEALGIHYCTNVIWQPSATDTVDVRIHHSEFTGTATLQYEAQTGLPRQLYVEDVGPRTPI